MVQQLYKIVSVLLILVPAYVLGAGTRQFESEFDNFLNNGGYTNGHVFDTKAELKKFCVDMFGDQVSADDVVKYSENIILVYLVHLDKSVYANGVVCHYKTPSYVIIRTHVKTHKGWVHLSGHPLIMSGNDEIMRFTF